MGSSSVSFRGNLSAVHCVCPSRMGIGRRAMLRTIALAFTAVLGLGLTAAASGPVVTHTQTFSFAPGGTVRIYVRAGDVKIIRGSDPQHIVLRYTAKNSDDGEDASGRLNTRFEVKGSQVEIDIKGRMNC